MLLLGGQPGHRCRIHHPVRDEDPARAERPQYPRLRDVRDGEPPRAPARLFGGQLRGHRRLDVWREVQAPLRAELCVPVEVRVQRRTDQDGDRRGEPTVRYPPPDQIVHSGRIRRQPLVPPVDRLVPQPLDRGEVQDAHGSAATTSISTRMPCSCEPTVVRTGYGAGNSRSYTALYAAKSDRSARCAVTFTTCDRSRPTWARARSTLRMTPSVCASMPSGTASVRGSCGPNPAVNTRPPATATWLYGPAGRGSFSLVSFSTPTILPNEPSPE